MWTTFVRPLKGLSYASHLLRREEPKIAQIHCSCLQHKHHRTYKTRSRRSEKGWWDNSQPYSNPLQQLQPLLECPVIPDRDLLYNPSEDKVKDAQKHYKSSHHNYVKIQKGIVHLEKMDPQMANTVLPEVTFIGRSNVGKSSLIRGMFQNFPQIQNKVSVSKTPGHTKTIKMYQVGNYFSLVDLPGYGHNMPKYFKHSVEAYLNTRRQLCRTFLLIDSLVPLKESDLVAMEMLEEFGKPYVIVLTKIDKGTLSQVLKTFLMIQRVRQENTTNCFPQPFLVSAKTGSGLAFLQSFISYVSGNLTLEDL